MFTHRGVGNAHQHETVDQARECEGEYAEAEAEMLAEAASERAYSETLEARAERGTWFGGKRDGFDDF